MTHKFRTWLMICGLIFISPALLAQYTLEYSTNGSVITVTNYTGLPVNVTVPGFVTAIGQYAFEYCTTLQSIIIDTNVTDIASGAFFDCPGLTSVTIPNGVTSIDGNAFTFCSDLGSVSIPASVTNIGAGAFVLCSAMTTISVNASNAYYSSSNGVLFNQAQSVLLEYPGGAAGGYAIPNGVAIIESNAFEGCAGLSSVTIPGSVTTIEVDAFSACGGLSSVAIPANVTNIGNNAFNACNGLTNIDVDPSNPAYSTLHGVLFDKGQTVLVEYPGGLAGNYTIPATVTNLGDYAFDDCNNLTGVTMPASVTSIGQWTFEECGRLTSMAIGGGVKTIGEGAFAGCYEMTNLIVGNNVTNLADYAFEDCQVLGYVLFTSNAPAADCTVFEYDPATLYYLPGASGWGSNFACLTAELWNPTIPSHASFGVNTNQFGFTINASTNIPIVIAATTNLATARWTPLENCTVTNGSIYFSDPAWSSYPGRFYSIQFP